MYKKYISYCYVFFFMISFGTVWAYQFSGGPWLPSKYFDKQYNGDVLMDPDAGPWPENTWVTWRQADGHSINAGIASWMPRSSDCEGPIFGNVDSTTNLFNPTVGYTIEFRLATVNDTCQSTPIGAWQSFFAGYDGKRWSMRGLKDGILIWDDAGTFTVKSIDGAAYDQYSMHTFRASKKPNASDWSLWIDGHYIANVVQSSSAIFSLGDTSGTAVDGTIDMDYFRCDTTGGWDWPSSSIVIEESSYPDGTTDVSEEGPASDTYLVGPAWGSDEQIMVTVTPDNSEVTLNGQAAGIPLVLTFAATGDTHVAASPQLVTVQAVDDAITEGPHTTILTHTAASVDADFDGVSISDVVLNIEDNDISGGIVLEPSAVNLDENDASAVSYTVKLLVQPISSTTVSIGNGGGQVSVVPSLLTFDTGNWQTPQSVDISVVDDSDSEGPHTAVVEHTGSGGGYSGVSSSLTVNIADNEQYCGQPGTVYLAGDINQDCYVDFLDLVELSINWLTVLDMDYFALMAANWLDCTDPFNSAGCLENHPRDFNFGLMLNDDGASFLEGRSAYYGRTAAEMLYDVDDTIESMVGTNVDCFMFCVALGSENTYYPTHVSGGAPVGWQFGPFHPGVSSTWAYVSVVDYARAWMAVAPRDPAAVHFEYPDDPMDIVYYIAKRAKARGLNFFPSIRINDAHFASTPWWDALMTGTHYAGEIPETLPATGNWAPTTGKFWVNHNGNPAGEEDGILDNNRLDFAVQSVRDYRMDMIHEVLERYRNQISGIELDFTRHGMFFSDPNEPNNKALITAMVKEVRQHLDDLERRTDTNKYLVVRVLPSLENSVYGNLDVDAWLEWQDVAQYQWSNTDPFAAPTAYPGTQDQAVYYERLVDVVVPEQLYSLASDMPIYDGFSGDTSDDYLELANGAGIYPTIYERSHWSWPFVAAPNANDYTADKANQRPSPELVAGAASNYWAMGCDGFQMYNYRLPLDEQMSGEPAGASPLGETVAAMLDTESSLDGQNRIYEVQPASSATSDIYNSATYYNTSLYNYQKQIPRILSDGVEETLKMYIGDFDSVTPQSVKLRLGLVMTSSGDPDYESLFSDQSATIIIKIGNTQIVSGDLSDYLLVTGKDVSGNPVVSAGYPSVSRAYFQVSITNPLTVLNQASENTIGIEIGGNTIPLALVELQVGVFYP